MNDLTLIRAVSSAALLTLLLSACSDGNKVSSSTTQSVNVNELSPGAGDNAETTTAASPEAQVDFPDWVTYQDANVQFRHPPSLDVETSPDGESVQFLDPMPNQLGGNDNCGLLVLSQLDATLAEQALVAETALYKTTPTPQTEFLEVNGEPAARISGNLDLDSAFSIPGRTQVMHRQNFTYLLMCVGFTTDVVDGMFDSVLLMN